MDKGLSILVDRLKRIFPHLKMYNEGHEFGDGDFKTSDDYAPPVDLDWFAVIEELEKNGLTIVNKKEVGGDTAEERMLNLARAKICDDIIKRNEEALGGKIIDMKKRNRDKLLDAVLKKHREDKGT